MNTVIENSKRLNAKDKLVEYQLRESEMCFRRVFEDSPIGMAMADPSLHFIRANAAFCQMTGYIEKELNAVTFSDITHPEDLSLSKELTNKLLNGEIPCYQMEKRYIRKTGDTIWASATITAIRDERGDFLYFLGMIEDITERKHTEMELRRLNEKLREHNRIKNEFVSTVSHELRTPLCVFKNIISNALAGILGSISPKLRSNLETANQNIDRLARIVNEFLDVAQIESGKTQLVTAQVDMRSLIRQAVDEFGPVALSRNININTVLPGKDTVCIEANRDKLVQVLINLIGNAAKFISAGGHILVTLSNHDDYISVAVHDDGPGIEPKYIDKIFDRFEMGATSIKSGRPGTGLGLNISKELVELHHGRIWAESIFGHGSTFTFTLPTKQPVPN